MPSIKTIEHEQHRWSYMTRDQLLSRLNKMKNPDKLACFIWIANVRDLGLAETAWERCYDLGLDRGVRRIMDDIEDMAVPAGTNIVGSTTPSHYISRATPVQGRGRPLSEIVNNLPDRHRLVLDMPERAEKQKPKRKKIRVVRFGKK